jgi:aerobic-type carbon monoxide dehydrogenase small subunit (CoxS/CutS family)
MAGAPVDGLCGMLGVGLAGFTGWRLFGRRVGMYAALVLGSCFYWIACSQIDSLDMGLSGMMTLALCGLLLAQRDAASPVERRNWMLACWAGMALAVLSKGLIGIVLPGAVLVLYMARRARLEHVAPPAPGARPAAVPVHLRALVRAGRPRNPEQPHFFFIHEHFDRFLLKEHHREGAWWIFLALLAAGSLPWLGVLGQSLAAGRERSAGRFQPRLLLLVWVVFIVAFFTKSNSKLPGYILPVFPALALLVGDYLARAGWRHLAVNALLMWALGIGLLVLVPFATAFGSRPGETALYEAYQPWILAGGCIALAGGMCATYWTLRLRRDHVVIALAVAGFLTTQLLLAGFEPIGQARAGVNLLPAMAAEIGPATRIYSVGIYEQSLTFYLQRPVVLVDYRDEFDFGLGQEPQLGLPTVAAFVRQWRGRYGRGPQGDGDHAWRPAGRIAAPVNGQRFEKEVDTRTTLLDLLREHMHLTGTKKGCDQGQCGACTVIVDGRRINSCLSLAVMHEGSRSPRSKAWASPDKLHPMQAAFVKHDGYQCGYCTPGQICSSVAVLDEIKRGIPSHVTGDLTAKPLLSLDELRERMSGNICRCGAYSNIMDAITEVAGQGMKAFTYERARTPAEAAAALAAKPGARFIAGGTNLLDLMKLEIETPPTWSTSTA